MRIKDYKKIMNVPECLTHLSYNKVLKLFIKKTINCFIFMTITLALHDLTPVPINE